MSRPRVVIFNIASLDGRLTLAPGVGVMSGDERWSTMTRGMGDPYLWAREAHHPDLLLEGSGSFLTPAHTDLYSVEQEPPPEGEHFLPTEIAKAPGRRWLTVVDGAGLVDLQLTEWPDPSWAGWHALVLTSRAAPPEHLAVLRDRGIPYLVAGHQHVALGRALELVRSLLGVHTVVSTGGGRLGGALLRQGLVDEIDIEFLPWVIGGRGTPALFDCAPLDAAEWPTRLELIEHEVLLDGRIRLRYAVTTG